MNSRAIAEHLIDCLKREFDLPFTVDVKNQNSEVKFKLRPANDDESLFEANIYVRDNIRYKASLKPQKYGRAFVSTMEKADDDMKSVFTCIVKRLLSDGCKISIKINDNESNPLDIYSWPEHWDKIEINVSKSPFFFLDFTDKEVDYLADISVKVVSLFLSLVPINIIEESDTEIYEGDESIVQGKKYERNPIARRLCIQKYGCKCAVCGFDFEKEYGPIGKGFIEVHHIVPISSIGHNHIIDPEADLIPLCSNCHSMIHRRTPPYLPKELIEIIKGSFVEK